MIRKCIVGRDYDCVKMHTSQKWLPTVPDRDRSRTGPSSSRGKGEGEKQVVFKLLFEDVKCLEAPLGALHGVVSISLHYE